MMARVPFPLANSSPSASMSWGLTSRTCLPSSSKVSGHSHMLPMRPRFSAKTPSYSQLMPSALR